MITRRIRFQALLAVLAVSLMAVLSVDARPATEPDAGVITRYDWLQFNGDPQHSGNNTKETTISLGNVANLQLVSGFPVSLPSTADGAPAYLTNVSTANGVKDLVFVTTKDGHLIALDAHSGAQVWSQQHPAGSCTINGGSDVCYTTSSPAIDPNRRFVYSYGLDGYVHKHQVSDGTEVTTGGWPELATRKPYTEKGSSALSIATSQGGTSYLYVTNGGYPGDAGNYQGHVTTINLQTGSQYVFNVDCSNKLDAHFREPPTRPSCTYVQSAIWARSGVVYDNATNRIYMTTGNGDYSPANHNWGDTVFALRPNGTANVGTPLDTYTPTNYQFLQNTDEDLGSTAPAILPAPASSTIQHLALQSGKDAKIRLLNLDNLSGQGGAGHIGGEIGPIIAVPQGGEVLTAPAVWRNPSDGSTWTFVTNDNGVSGLKLTVDNSGTPSLTVKWQDTSPGSSPLVANGVVYKATSNSIQARDPITGNVVWSSSAIGSGHWNSPIVASGALYVSDENNRLFAFALNGIIPSTR